MSQPLDPLPHAILTVDKGRVIQLEGSAEELFGLPHSEALGRQVAELIDQVDRALVNLTITPVHEHGPSSSAPGPHDRDATTRGLALRALLEAAERMAHMGSWELDLETEEVRWSDHLYRIFGLEPGEISPSMGS